MKKLTDILLTIGVLGGILILSAIVTGAFTRAMYYRCAACGNLNAKRRSLCRVCGEPIGPASQNEPQ
jgi:hypothetical protein